MDGAGVPWTSTCWHTSIPAGTEMSVACLPLSLVPPTPNRFNPSRVLVFPEPRQKEKNDKNKHTIPLPHRQEGFKPRMQGVPGGLYPQLHSCYAHAHGLFTWVEAVWCVMLARDQEIIELISSQVRRHICLPKEYGWLLVPCTKAHQVTREVMVPSHLMPLGKCSREGLLQTLQLS